MAPSAILSQLDHGLSTEACRCSAAWKISQATLAVLEASRAASYDVWGPCGARNQTWPLSYYLPAPGGKYFLKQQ